MVYEDFPRPAQQRLADFHVTLFCPAGATEERLDRLCEVLEAIDFRSKIQAWLEWYTRNRHVLRGITIRVEE